MVLAAVVNDSNSQQIDSLRNDEMTKYVVAYAKITTDKSGVKLQGVYFGGVGDSLNEANELASECVNKVKGGAILPKVYPINSRENLVDILYNASNKFEQITYHMQEAEKIVSRTQK